LPEADVVLVISGYDVDRFIAVFGKASDDATARGWWDAIDTTQAEPIRQTGAKEMIKAHSYALDHCEKRR
jgi:hypothetical protein